LRGMVSLTKRRYDPDGYYDPDPDPIAFTTIFLVGMILAGLTTTGIAIQNPTFFDHLLMTINPAIKEETEEERKASKEFWRNIMIICFIILCIVGLLIWYRYSSHKKAWKRRR